MCGPDTRECERKVPGAQGTVSIEGEDGRTCTDQHVLLWAEHQLPAPCSGLLAVLPPAGAWSAGAARSAGAAAGSILRNGEGPGDQEPEGERGFRGVGQLQVAGGHQLTQHLGGHRGGEPGGPSLRLPQAYGSGLAMGVLGRGLGL